MSGNISEISPRQSQSALALGKKLKSNRYEIRKIIGKGAFGITYGAWDSSVHAEVAIKEYFPWDCPVVRNGNRIVPPQSNHGNFELKLANVFKEALALAKFDHPNIVTEYDCFYANGTAYLVSKYETGQGLLAFLERYPRVHEKELLAIIYPLLEGLRMVHMAGIVHRDIKPSDIIVRPDGSPCLVDFGTAPDVSSKQLLPSVSRSYSPPERFDEHDKDGAWTDIFSLGAVCYRVIAGQPPESALTRLDAIRLGKPDPLLPAEEVGRGHYRLGILRGIDGALRLEPAQRPQNTREWMEVLVPTGMQNDMPNREHRSLLDKVRHLFRSPKLPPSLPVQQLELEPVMDATKASAAICQATETYTDPSGEEEINSAANIDNLSKGPAEPSFLQGSKGFAQACKRAAASEPLERSEDEFSPEDDKPPSPLERTATPAHTALNELVSSPEVERFSAGDELSTVSPTLEITDDSCTHDDDRRPPKLERAGAPAHNEVASSESAQANIMPAPTEEEGMSTQAGEFPPSATTKPPASLPKRRSIEASALPEGDAPPRRMKALAELPTSEDIPDVGTTPQSTGEGGFDKFFESSFQPLTTKSSGIEEFPLRLETPPHEKKWSDLFARHEHSHFMAEAVNIEPGGSEKSQAGLSVEAPKAALDKAKSAIAAHNDRAWQLFRKQDYAGALTELEAAKTLEPNNPMLLANVRRIERVLQGSPEPKGDPWATS